MCGLAHLANPLPKSCPNPHTRFGLDTRYSEGKGLLGGRSKGMASWPPFRTNVVLN